MDEVLPRVPLRQWVLSFPFPLRYLFAGYPALMTKALSVVYRSFATWLIHRAGCTHKTARTGAVTFIQRFGSALNLNVHFHMLFLDGVYLTRAEGDDRFRPVARMGGFPLHAGVVTLVHLEWTTPDHPSILPILVALSLMRDDMAKLEETRFYVAFRVREFDIPPVHDGLVLGRNAPIGCIAMRRCLDLLAASTFEHIELDDEVISDVLIRNTHLRRLPREKFIAYVLENIKPLMCPEEVMHFDIEIEVEIGGKL